MARTRKSMVGVLLFCALAGLGALLFFREHGSAEALKVKAAEKSASADVEKSKATGKTKAPDTKVATSKDPDHASDKKEPDPPEAAKPEPPPLDRPLRVVSLGWDLAVPGHLANAPREGGESALAQRKLEVEFKAVTELSRIKSALANGGSSKTGADIAILPLPEMVASYEDLRALKPQIFFVAGWSRGRDAVFASAKTSLLKLRKSKPVTLSGSRGSSAMLLSLYALDIAGVSPKKIRISGEAQRDLMFSAIDRGRSAAIPNNMSIALTSADASALIPFVAIAPEGFLKNRRAVAAWIAAWLEGVEQLEGDVPKAARQISAISGAPETMSLVRRLGLIEFSGLRDNVRRAGLAGRDPVTLRRLFELYWRLWRGVDVLTTPAPKAVPIAFDTIASLVRENPGLALREEVEPNFTTEPLVRGTAKDMDSAALMAGVFARSSVRLGAYGKKRRSQDALDEFNTRYGLRASRFEAKSSLSKKKTIVLEVYAAP
jgi:hypothetical protein